MTPDSSAQPDLRPHVPEHEPPISTGIGSAGLSWPKHRRLALAAWWWITVGGALSALFCLGPASMLYFMVSIPIGAMVGAVVGIPGAAALAAWIRRHHDPPTDPTGFTNALGAIGMAAALVGCGLCAWSWAVPLLLADVDLNPRTVVIGIASATFTVGAVAASGRWVGRRLAFRYLRAWGLAAPTSWIGRLH